MIIPAFDLINSQIVRLYQGNYLNQKKYDIDLIDYLEQYQSLGIKIVHLVDLDGAKNANNRQIKLFNDILSSTNISVQIGGGIRTEKDVSTLLELGAKRVVIGSAVIQNPKKIKKWLQIYGPDAIALALDVRIDSKNNKKIYVNGWVKKTNFILEDIIEYFLSSGLKHVLCTDISKDGTLLGPNIKLYQDITNTFKNIEFQASGGVSSLLDIISLKKTGVKSIVIGKSLLEKKFTIKEALQCWRNES